MSLLSFFDFECILHGNDFMCLSWVLCPENYILPNQDEKYDVIPEFWQGHNIADFVDPDIMKVSLLMLSLHVFN